jgi:erythromycin esterase-like protein
MWRNAEFTSLLRWIRDRNRRLPHNAPRVHLHGMDLLDLPDATQDGSPAAAPPDTVQAADAASLDARQSALAFRNAAAYFALQQTDAAAAWNIRDAHMAATIDNLIAHLDAIAPAPAGIVIWAHNAHIGDMRATARGDNGSWSLGQLLRERHPGRVFNIGFTTAAGVVWAATNWGERGRRKALRRPIAGSHAALLGRTGLPRFYCVFADDESLRAALAIRRPQRGIGVRYLPWLEREGHYYDAALSRQFDAVVHIETTHALHPRIAARRPSAPAVRRAVAPGAPVR